MVNIVSKYRRKKNWVIFVRWLNSKFDYVTAEKSSEQDKAFRIAKKLIIDSESFLYADLSKERYMIVNDVRFVRITNEKIRIVDGTYKYDVSFDPRMLVPLKNLFAKNLEHRHDRLENEVNIKVERSLDHILTDIKNQEKQ